MDSTDTAQSSDKYANLTDSTWTRILLTVMQWKYIFPGLDNENQQSFKFDLTMHNMKYTYWVCGNW